MELTSLIDIYAYHLGTLIGNLHSLEVALRVALSKGQFTVDLGVSEGQQVDQSAINEWAYLSDLVRRYNAQVSQTHPHYVLTKGLAIIDLRNALAHGIVLAKAPQPPLRLLKFGKVGGSKDKVVVEFSAEMTDQWLQDQRRMVWNAVEIVGRYLQELGIGQPPT